MINVNVTLSPVTTQRARTRARKIAATAIAVALLPVLALASPVDLPHAFESGAPVSAAEFNENFDAVAVAVDDNDTRITALEDAGSQGGAIPSGMVSYFDAAECPAGWSELAEARGRTLVGMNGSAATLLGTVGEAFEDLEDRAHSHGVTIAGFSTNSASASHTHTIPQHTTQDDGAHNHQWFDGPGTTFNSAGNAQAVAIVPFDSAPGPLLPNWGNGNFYTNNVSDHDHTVNAFTSGSSSSTAHSHAVATQNTVSSGATTSGVMPYVQLLVCRRD